MARATAPSPAKSPRATLAMGICIAYAIFAGLAAMLVGVGGNWGSEEDARASGRAATWMLAFAGSVLVVGLAMPSSRRVAPAAAGGLATVMAALLVAGGWKDPASLVVSLLVAVAPLGLAAALGWRRGPVMPKEK